MSVLTFKVQRNKIELFIEKHGVRQWLKFIYEHADPIIVARD